jgi:hypothetical protein
MAIHPFQSAGIVRKSQMMRAQIVAGTIRCIGASCIIQKRERLQLEEKEARRGDFHDKAQGSIRMTDK